jgi:hypothetical protein
MSGPERYQEPTPLQMRERQLARFSGPVPIAAGLITDINGTMLQVQGLARPFDVGAAFIAQYHPEAATSNGGVADPSTGGYYLIASGVEHYMGATAFNHSYARA